MNYYNYYEKKMKMKTISEKFNNSALVLNRNRVDH